MDQQSENIISSISIKQITTLQEFQENNVRDLYEYIQCIKNVLKNQKGIERHFNFLIYKVNLQNISSELLESQVYKNYIFNSIKTKFMQKDLYYNQNILSASEIFHNYFFSFKDFLFADKIFTLCFFSKAIQNDQYTYYSSKQKSVQMIDTLNQFNNNNLFPTLFRDYTISPENILLMKNQDILIKEQEYLKNNYNPDLIFVHMIEIFSIITYIKKKYQNKINQIIQIKQNSLIASGNLELIKIQLEESQTKKEKINKIMQLSLLHYIESLYHSGDDKIQYELGAYKIELYIIRQELYKRWSKIVIQNNDIYEKNLWENLQQAPNSILHITSRDNKNYNLIIFI
ncbi:hypothetical protein ABPG72_018979 [Tetrahymena utriculariae]